MMKLSRRHILKLAGTAAIISIIGYRQFKAQLQKKIYAGKVTGASFSRGHLLRDPKFSGEVLKKKVDTLIIGAGVSGLSAGYHLLESGHEDFVLIDLEKEVGGNSRYGKHADIEHPYGAHYVPVLSQESNEILDFFRKVGIVEQNSQEIRYNEYYICSDPQERLFIHGRWQEGIVPKLGLSEKDHHELDRFFELMDFYQNAKGSDQKRFFTLPLRKRSQDKKYNALDRITMQEFLEQEEFKSEYLNWYVNYCCFDDYGVSAADISAWAGIHYFASRNGSGANINSGDILTWPEGNGFLVKKLSQFLKKHIRLETICFDITKSGKKYIARTYHFAEKKIYEYEARHIIYSSPLFTAKKVFKVDQIKNELAKVQFDYAPWMVANIELNEELAPGDLDFAWDNVNYHGKSLGYILSEHQGLRTDNKRAHLTQYWPLKKVFPTNTRAHALKTTHQEWCELVLSELELTHKDIRKQIKQIDIALWGHAMRVPQIGFLDGQLNLKNERVYFAHTDQVGISIFEEAFYQGFDAAKKVLEG